MRNNFKIPIIQYIFIQLTHLIYGINQLILKRIQKGLVERKFYFYISLINETRFNMRLLIKIFKALSDPNRLRIIKMLEVRPLCVCEIVDILQLANSTVSKHLSILRDVELILDEKEGKWVYYRLNDNANDLYLKDLLPLLKEWISDDGVIQNDRNKILNVSKETICKI